MNYLSRCLIILVAVGFSQLSSARVPLIDNQPAYTEDCPITNVASTQDEDGTAQVRNYNCVVEGVNVVWSLSIPDGCSEGGCGLIVDIHGAGMNANVQNNGTRLRQYGADAAQYGATTPYIVLQPNFTDIFDDVTGHLDLFSLIGAAYNAELPNMDQFIDDVVTSLNVDLARIHMNGFSRGASTVAVHYCDAEKNIRYASFSGAGGPVGCDVIAGKPYLSMNGTTDPFKMYFTDLTEEYMLNLAGVVETTLHEDDDWQSQKFTFSWAEGFIIKGQHIQKSFVTEDRVFESIRHSASGVPVFGHCHPVLGRDRWLTCSANFDTGRKLIDFFIKYPKT